MEKIGVNLMTTEQLNIIVPGLTTIAGAAIGAWIAYLVGRQQFKANVVSANRQIWINTLRDCVAEFQSVTLSVLITPAREHIEKFDEKIDRLNFLRSKILLLVNPLENDHQELCGLVQKVIEIIAEDDEKINRVKLHSAQEAIIQLSQKILKREWERVKKGQ